ncbi:hypothetical protein D9757_000726 [Collybiopsis confluens]|uniref:Uncharacterized protein n=1 Tax=Collybiopsis confluens TaxID=2823264 RepID=A0A8H5I146_9AGAR|nr:hypothetical protein D9757_000726 [Collybiopsis confluens]
MVSTQIKYIASASPSVPAFALEITRLVDSYMIWISPTELLQADVQNAPRQANLCRDWACAMPPKDSAIQASTSIFRTPNSDLSISMAQRFARKFGKQIFLSIDIQHYAGKPEVVLAMEKGISQILKGL